jgi:hypothetical protein
MTPTMSLSVVSNTAAESELKATARFSRLRLFVELVSGPNMLFSILAC